jgi:hypothetical protein
MTMRYVHPAAVQKRVVIEKFEKFRADEIIVAANKVTESLQKSLQWSESTNADDL